MFNLDGTFFRDYWRRRPVLLRAAAIGLLGEAPSGDVLERLREAVGSQAKSDGKSIWFYQQIVNELPLTGRLVGEARKFFEWEDVACDLIHTKGPASIGCHFDEGDNFSLQLVGAKRWRLSPPGTLPPDLVRLRALKEPEVGRAELGPDVTEFFVEAGDVLYIPQYWIHWGESTGDSTSISLVVNSRTFHLEYAASVPDALRRFPRWAHSVPVGPGSKVDRVRALDDLIRETFTDDAGRRALPYISTRGISSPLSVDMDRVRAFVATAPTFPAQGFVLPRDGLDTHQVLRALLARRTLRRLLALIVKRFELTRSARHRGLYQQCVEVLLARTDEAIERLCSEPEIVSIVAVSLADEVRYEDPLAEDLACILIPEFEASGADSEPFVVLPDLDGAFTLRRAGVRVITDTPYRELVIRVVSGKWMVHLDGRLYAPTLAPGLRLEELPRLCGNGPHLSPAPTTWLARNVRGQELSVADPAAFREFCGAMLSGAEALAAAWPAAWREVREGIRWLLPLPDRGPAAFNYSVHAFRGLIVSSPRRNHRCAQTLAHEAGHNRLSTLLDLVDLCADPSRVVTSPVVNAARPISFVFHGCFAFIQDVVVTERLLPSASNSERASMERYLDEARRKTAEALKVLRRETAPTAVGEVVLSEIAEALDQ